MTVEEKRNGCDSLSKRSMIGANPLAPLTHKPSLLFASSHWLFYHW